MTNRIAVEVPPRYGMTPEKQGQAVWLGDHWHASRPGEEAAEYFCGRVHATFRELFWSGKRPVGVCQMCLTPLIGIKYSA